MVVAEARRCLWAPAPGRRASHTLRWVMMGGVGDGWGVWVMMGDDGWWAVVVVGGGGGWWWVVGGDDGWGGWVVVGDDERGVR